MSLASGDLARVDASSPGFGTARCAPLGKTPGWTLVGRPKLESSGRRVRAGDGSSNARRSTGAIQQSLDWERAGVMDIRFVSSMTPEDEDRVAPGLLSTIGLLLDALPLAYTLRIETSNGKIFQHTRTTPDVGAEPGPDTMAATLGRLLRQRSAS